MPVQLSVNKQDGIISNKTNQSLDCNPPNNVKASMDDMGDKGPSEDLKHDCTYPNPNTVSFDLEPSSTSKCGDTIISNDIITGLENPKEPNQVAKPSSLENQSAPPLSTSLGFNFNFNSNLSILRPSVSTEPDTQIQSYSMKTQSQCQSLLFDNDSQNSINKSLDILLQKNPLADQIDISAISEFGENTPLQDIANSPNNSQTIPALPKAIDFASMLGTNKLKLVRLSNGKTISLKPKSKSTLSIDETQEHAIPSNYGVNIKTIYQEMEHRTRMEQISSINSSSSVSRKNCHKNDVSHRLWAEKYRPKSFFDLVGNEKANRSALKWLRHWAKATFGEDIREELENLKKKEFYQNNNVILAEDPYQRPKKKILLLAGPPGIGKTTVAHLMCKHLGYDTMEINASDERAGQEVKNKIHDSMDTHSFLGKPKCIIADEIDGASENGFVKVLIDLIYSDSRAIKKLSSIKNKEENKNKKNNNLIGKILLRPIVAICNDIYAPVLEKLKPFCEIVNFKKPRIDQIKTRLEEVVKLESKHSLSDTVVLSSKELSSIIEISNFDIRSCLNLLQFNHTMDKKSQAGTQRYKDLEQSWFLLLAKIFKLNFHENKSVTFNNLEKSLANSSASMDKIINGCFQKYPQFSNYKDVKLLNKAENISDWLYYYDIMNCSSASNSNIGYVQSLELTKYGNVAPMKFFLLFAEGNSSSEKYLNDGQTRYNTRNFFENKKNNQYLLEKSIMNNVNMSPSLFTALNRRNYLSTEILPLINNFILNPDLNTVVQTSSSSNFKQTLKNGSDSNVNFNINRQKSVINHIIDILEDFAFSIEINDKNTYNGQGFEICPILESITKFDSKFCSSKYFNEDFMHEIGSKEGSGGFRFKNLDSSRQKALKYVFFEMEKRKAAIALTNNNKRKKDEEDAKDRNSNNSEHNNKLPKNVRTSLFFTNLKNNLGQTNGSHDHEDESQPFELKVWVKYHEGFSNAVRKNVTWDELWI